MAERARSKDGSQETREYVDDDLDTPDQQGAAGGTLERKVGSRDEEKAAEGNDGNTRVTGSDENGHDVDGPNSTQSGK